MEARIIIQGKNDEAKLTNIKQPVADLSQNERITFALIEGGMASGEPSVMIISQDDLGSVVLSTSLDKFLTSGSTMAASAEKHWGWKRPEGHASLMPMDKEARKVLLEALIKELQEWDDSEEESDG